MVLTLFLARKKHKVQWILCFLGARNEVRTISQSPMDSVFVIRKKSSKKHIIHWTFRNRSHFISYA